ncbi:MAG TPA: C1 family peptidase [Pirellulales bacterium]|nr:C1 family peptidase [Pirellulales bacterium]
MPKLRSHKRYGWVRDLPDHRDFLYSAPPHVLQNLPSAIDLRASCPPVYDQGDLGSCTANALAGADQFDQLRQDSSAPFVPSRLFIYYGERQIEGTIDSDSGAQLRDGMKVMASEGAPPETDWPYDISQFTVEPAAQAYADGLQHKVTAYQRIPQNLTQMKACLAAGFPFVFGFTVYDSFESDEVAASGIVNMPGPTEQVVGGHAVMACGYSDAQGRFIVRNSWGEDWGQAGYFTMPYAYLLSKNLCSDFWTLRTVA